jgi:hypothetical protein
VPGHAVLPSMSAGTRVEDAGAAPGELGAAGEAGAAGAAPFRRRSGVDHIRALYVQTPASLTGNGVGIVLMTLIFWPLAPRSPMLAWLAVVAALWLLRVAHYVRYLQYSARQEATEDRLRQWRRCSNWCWPKTATPPAPSCAGRWPARPWPRAA